MTIVEGALYGAVQGLSEFLPISSSAHLTLLPWFFGWEDPGLGFDVALHVGTLVAVLWYFWRDWWTLATGTLASLYGGRLLGNRDAEIFWRLVVATIPAALIGMALEHQAEEAFRAPALIGTTLAGVGLLLYWSDKRPESRHGLEAIGWTDALWIGLAQAAAIVPGVSRSGITITTSRFLGVDREASARFSFLLSTPIIAGAALVKVKALAEAMHDPAGIVALLASAVLGFAAIGGLLRYVRGRSYTPFVVYRLVLAALVFVLVARE
jgi:undecaprenyl-diphosphatase